MTEPTESPPDDEDGRIEPATTRLLLDTMLGSLATYCRMCGYDAAYAPERGVEADGAVARLAAEENRTLLTRDVALAERAEDAICLTERDVTDQLRELAEAGFDLTLRPERCSTCNGSLESVGPTAPTPEYAPDPADETVWQCGDCGQHFWRGSHWEDVAQRLAAVREEVT